MCVRIGKKISLTTWKLGTVKIADHRFYYSNLEMFDVVFYSDSNSSLHDSNGSHKSKLQHYVLIIANDNHFGLNKMIAHGTSGGMAIGILIIWKIFPEDCIYCDVPRQFFFT